MRATVRLADGRVVDGEVLLLSHDLPAAVNACAGNAQPFVYTGGTITAVRFAPPAPTNACAGNVTAYWCQP